MDSHAQLHRPLARTDTTVGDVLELVDTETAMLLAIHAPLGASNPVVPAKRVRGQRHLLD